MKKHAKCVSWRTLLLISSCLLWAPYLSAQGEFEVEQTQFQLDIAELEVKVEGGLRKLGDGYKGALINLQKRYMQRGALDETLIIRNELTRLETETSAPDVSAPGLPADVVRYMKAYTKNYKKLMSGWDSRSAMIIKAYVAKMDQRKVDLTRKGDIPGATRAKAEVDRVKSVYAAVLNPPPARGVNAGGGGGRPAARPGNHASLQAFKSRFPHLVGSLMTYYSFDNDSSSQVSDHSKNGYHARVKGVSFKEGRKGQGIEVDDDDAVNMGTKTGIHGLKMGSFSFWVKTRARSGVMLSSYAQNGSRGFRVGVNGKGLVQFLLGNENTGYYGSYNDSYDKRNTRRSDKAESAKAVNDGHWHHVVVVRDKKKVFIYLDGEKGASSFTERLLMDADGDLRINGYQYSSYSEDGGSYANYDGIHGSFDDFMAFSKPLSEQEVKSIYTLQK